MTTRRRKFSSPQLLVEVAAGEAEAAAAVGAIERPGQDLLAARVLLRRRGAAHVVGRRGLEDRRHALHFRLEADVEVPFVLERERLDAARDRVFGQRS